MTYDDSPEISPVGIPIARALLYALRQETNALNLVWRDCYADRSSSAEHNSSLRTYKALRDCAIEAIASLARIHIPGYRHAIFSTLKEGDARYRNAVALALCKWKHYETTDPIYVWQGFRADEEIAIKDALEDYDETYPRHVEQYDPKADP